MSSVRSKTAMRNDPPKEATAVSEKARVVLAGARAVFLANGFAAATTDMIQQAAGVSKSTVYAYYPNKEALFVAVVEAECARFLKTINETQFSGKRLGETLLAMAQAYLGIVLSSDALALYRMVVAEAPRLPELGRRFYVAGPATINTIVAQRLEVAVTNGELELSGIGLDSAASLFVNMVRGEAQMQCLTHPNAQASAVQRDQWAKDAVIAFLRAFPGKGTSVRQSPHSGKV